MERYEFLQRVGEGAYGSVWKCRDKETGELRAVKKLKDVPRNEEESEIALREVRLLQLARHRNVVNLLEAYRSQSGRLYLVFEYVERSLLQDLKACKQGLHVNLVKSITWQLLQSLSYLHRKKIIHRDIKPSNVLLTEDHTVKLCDFGFARPVSNAPAPDYTTYVVTRWYRAPEVLVGDTYGPPVDIWSLGCIFVEMLTGRPLFPGKNHHDQLWLILRCLGTMTERQLELLDSDPQFACFRLPLPSEIETLEQRLPSLNAPAMAFIRACLHPDPALRATADQLLAMPYFSGVEAVLPPDVAAEFIASQQHKRSLPSPTHAPGITHMHASPSHLQHQQQQPLPAKASSSSKLDVSRPGADRPMLQRQTTHPGSQQQQQAQAQQQQQQLAPVTVRGGQALRSRDPSPTAGAAGTGAGSRRSSSTNAALPAGPSSKAVAAASAAAAAAQRKDTLAAAAAAADAPEQPRDQDRERLRPGLSAESSSSQTQAASRRNSANGVHLQPHAPNGGRVTPPGGENTPSISRPHRTTWNGGAGFAASGGPTMVTGRQLVPSLSAVQHGYASSNGSYTEAHAAGQTSMHRKAQSMSGNEQLGIFGTGTGRVSNSGAAAPAMTAPGHSQAQAQGQPTGPQARSISGTAQYHYASGPTPGQGQGRTSNSGTLPAISGPGPSAPHLHSFSTATAAQAQRAAIPTQRALSYDNGVAAAAGGGAGAGMGTGYATHDGSDGSFYHHARNRSGNVSSNGGSINGLAQNHSQYSDMSTEEVEEPRSDGRRASDTVLYAAAALDMARARLTKAASIIERSPFNAVVPPLGPIGGSAAAAAAATAHDVHTGSHSQSQVASSGALPSLPRSRRPTDSEFESGAPALPSGMLPPLQTTPRKMSNGSDVSSKALNDQQQQAQQAGGSIVDRSAVAGMVDGGHFAPQQPSGTLQHVLSESSAVPSSLPALDPSSLRSNNNTLQRAAAGGSSVSASGSGISVSGPNNNLLLPAGYGTQRRPSKSNINLGRAGAGAGEGAHQGQGQVMAVTGAAGGGGGTSSGVSGVSAAAAAHCKREEVRMVALQVVPEARVL